MTALRVALYVAFVSLGSLGCGGRTPQATEAPADEAVQSTRVPAPPRYAHLRPPVCSEHRGRAGFACWRVRPSEGNAFVQVSASCGVTDTGHIDCWKTRLQHVPDGEFVLVDDDGRNACAARATGGVACWGEDPWPSVPAAGMFRYLAIGGSVNTTPDGAKRVSACGITDTGDIECWGNGRRFSGGYLRVAGPWVAVDLGRGPLMGLRPDGQLVRLDSPRAVVKGRYNLFSVRYGGECVVSIDDQLSCRHSSATPSVATPPRDLSEIRSIRTGWSHACALEVDGDVRCWGDARPPPKQKFESISHPDNWDSYCGLTPDGDAYCWGNASLDPAGQSIDWARHAVP